MWAVLDTTRELWPAWLHPRLHCDWFKSAPAVLLIHLSKIIHHNEEKQPLLNNVEKFPFRSPLFLSCCCAAQELRDESQRYEIMWGGQLSLTKAPQKKRRRQQSCRRQQSLLFVPLSVTQTPPHHGSFLPLSDLLCSPQQVNRVCETHNGQLMCKAHSGCDWLWWPQDLSHASAELTYSSSHSLCAWHTVISVIDICLGWRHHVTGGVMWPRSGVVSSVRFNCNADLAVVPLELCQPRPRCLSCWQLTTQWQASEWPILYTANLTGRPVERTRVRGKVKEGLQSWSVSLWYEEAAGSLSSGLGGWTCPHL